MVHPRIVPGREGAQADFGVRGNAAGEAFHIFVGSGALGAHPRAEVEDRLVEEAWGVMRRAEREGGLDWEGLGFHRSERFGSYEHTLTAADVKRLMGL